MKYRAEQFPNDFCASGDMMFCKFCHHIVDWKHIDTCKDHLQSKVYVKTTKRTVLLLLMLN